MLIDIIADIVATKIYTGLMKRISSESQHMGKHYWRYYNWTFLHWRKINSR